jgi:hypothetical protein
LNVDTSFTIYNSSKISNLSFCPHNILPFSENYIKNEIKCHAERLNLWTPVKGDAIVQTTEETCRGEFEAVPPPRNWSVS